MKQKIKTSEQRQPSIFEDARNNQPKSGVDTEEEEVRLGGSARRVCYSIVLVAFGSNNIIELKYNVELIK